MSARRSRLQIKPNVGGPKGVSSKATPKSKEDKQDIAKADNSNKTLAEVAKPEATNQNDKKVEGTKDDTDPAPPSVGVRARLRKFGKVSIPAARTKQSKKASNNNTEISSIEPGAADTQVEKVREVPEEDVSKCASETVLPSITEAVNKEISTPAAVSSNSSAFDSTDSAPAVEQSEGIEYGNKAEDSVESVSKDTATKPKTPVRTRLPKAKPNIGEASKRRPRPSENSPESTSVAGSANEIDRPQPVSSELPGSAYIPPPALGVHRPAAPLSRSPMKIAPAIPSSPVKQPGDKRTRTVSVTEPPPLKKPRKPLIQAPTDKPPDRTTMKMKDLIYWNPSSNPMKTKAKTDGKEKAKAITVEDLEKSNEEEEEVEEEEEEDLPVPQVTIGPDGNIVINEQSLVVKNKEKEEAAKSFNEVIDESEIFSTYGSFRKNNRSKAWSKKETAKFYKALSMVGIDFFLINQLFPNRKRFELKKKFKKEEKTNRVFIERVLKEGAHFDMSLFEQVDSEDDDEEKNKKKKKKEKPKKDTAKDVGGNKKNTSKNPRPNRKRKIKKTYYDMSTDESDEEETECESKTKKSNVDKTWQPPGVSGADGEVVNILMDMSEGRLAGPASNLSEARNTNVTATSLNKSPAVNQSDVNTVVPQVVTMPITLNVAKSTATDKANNDNSVTSTGNTMMGTNQQMMPVVYQSVDNGNAGVSVLPAMNSNDQFVLVTVMPDDGSETVLHVYRLSGGAGINSLANSNNEGTGSPQPVAGTSTVRKQTQSGVFIENL